jgi:hypothetical protein
MTQIDNATLLVALQAVYESIVRFEGLLKSETLSDRENITELLISYDEALEVLRSAYAEQLGKGASLPPLKSVIFDKA